MNSGFVKLYGTILTSSIWLENDATLRLWIAMLALCDKRGQVAGSVGGLAHTSRLTREKCEAALAVLSSPDADSRTTANEGRRIEKIDGGWQVLNHQLYRDQRSYDEGDTCYVYYAVAGNEVKIGTSKNPWARARELRTSRPDLVIAAVERGGRELEKDRHRQFVQSWIRAEWFSLTPEIHRHMQALQADPIPEQPVQRTPQHPHYRRKRSQSVATTVGDVVVGVATNVATVELPDTEAYTDTELTTTTPRPRKTKAPETFDLAPYIDAHRELFPESDPPAARYGKVFKRLERKHGAPETLSRWRTCLAQKQDFATPEELSSHWSRYDGAVWILNGQGSTSHAMKLISLVRERRNPMFPNNVVADWQQGLSDTDVQVCKTFGLSRILNDTNEGTVVAQLARALEESR